jgi:hypothetical protein
MRGRGPTAMDGRRPPGPAAGAGRGPAAARPGTDTPGPRGRTRETTPDQGGPTPRGAGDGARGGFRSHPPHPPGDRGGGGGVRNETRGPRSGNHSSARGGRAPPTGAWGARPPREGRTPDPSGHDGPGRRQAPRRPHDAGRPGEAFVSTRSRRRPARGGRPMLGDGGPPWEGPRRSAPGMESE